METGDLGHLGMEHVIVNLMIHSLSPQARRLMEIALTGDPFDIDIKLNKDCKNRNVEIFNTNFKTMGLRLIFRKILKKLINPITIQPIEFLEPQQLKNPITFINEDEVFDPIDDMDIMLEIDEEMKKAAITIYPINNIK
jgi:hypothetical protein